jgi:hypothetical protein
MRRRIPPRVAADIGSPSIRVTDRGFGQGNGMDVDAARERNQAKAREEAERGPARSEPDAAPIAEAIQAFHARGDLAPGFPPTARGPATWSPTSPP